MINRYAILLWSPISQARKASLKSQRLYGLLCILVTSVDIKTQKQSKGNSAQLPLTKLKLALALLGNRKAESTEMCRKVSSGSGRNTSKNGKGDT